MYCYMIEEFDKGQSFWWKSHEKSNVVTQAPNFMYSQIGVVGIHLHMIIEHIL
jgi:hypothetical protein